MQPRPVELCVLAVTNCLDDQLVTVCRFSQYIVGITRFHHPDVLVAANLRQVVLIKSPGGYQMQVGKARLSKILFSR